MGSIPLVALGVNTPNIAGEVQQLQGQKQSVQDLIAQAQQRKQQMAQQQALAPGALVAQSQQNQAGALQLQQQQQAANDQKALTAAMQQWDGKNYSDLTPLILKSGGSANAVTTLQQHIADLRNKAATTSKDEVENSIKANDQYRGRVQSVIDAPIDKKQELWDQEVTKEEQSGQIQPGSISHTYPGDDQAKVFANHFALGSMLAKEQLDKQTEATKLAAEQNTAANQELQRQQAATTQAERGRHNKATENIMSGGGLAAGGPLTPETTDMLAQRFLSTGQLPPGSRGPAGIAQNRAIMNRAQQIDPNATLAANAASTKADTASLAKFQTNYDQVNAFENTALKNLDLVQKSGAKIPDLSARFANVPVRMISSKMIGTPEMATFRTNLLTAQTEAAKVLNSANASGVLSDSARHEAQEILDGNLPYPAMVASINALKQDMGNRKQSYQEQLGEIKNRLNVTAGAKGAQGGEAQTAAPSKPAGATHTGISSVDGKKYWLDANQKKLGLAQ